MSNVPVTTPPDLATFGGGTLLGAAAGIKKGELVFQRYNLQKVLGVGGMGVVWLAHDQNLDQEVALKFVPDALRNDPDAIQDLKNQTKLGLKLTHENIVRVLGFESDDTLAAIVMEYVDGPTLAAMRVDQAAQVFEADSLHVYLLHTLKALEYAHEQARIVHRDLKPANVMVNSEDRVKVADFGIACSLRNSVGRVMSMPQRSGSGTLHYMSPQQLLGGDGCVADDIYSLGATVFELLAGTPPFHTGDISTQIQKIPAPSVTTRRQQSKIQGEPVPSAWEEVIAAALEKEPSLRPSNADEFRKGLLGQPFRRGTGANLAPADRHVPSYLPPAPLTPRPRAKILAIAAVAVLLLAGGVALMMSKGGAPVLPTDPAPSLLALKTREWIGLQSRAEAAENDSISAQEKLNKWNELLTEIKDSDFLSDAAVRKIQSRSEQRADHWKEEVRNARTTYQASVADLKRAIEDATKLSEQQEKGAASKAARWNEIVQKYLPIFLSADEHATDHISPLSEAKQQAAKWKAEEENETPNAMPPERVAFVGGPAANWAPYGKQELLKTIQMGFASFASTRNTGVTATGKWDQPTFSAVLVWQKSKGLPTTGVLDALTCAALGIQALQEPKAPVVATASKPPNSGGSGSKGSQNSGGAASSPQESNPWARAIQNRISGGGSLPGPPMPFGAN